MKTWERRTLNLLTILITVTGILYFGMKFLLESGDPFAVVNHPLQPLMLDLHILAAPFFLLIFGMILSSHVLKKVRSNRKPNRRTGWVVLVSFPLMAVSGYLLQVVSEPVLHQASLVLHLVSSGVFALTYLVHFLISLRLLARSSRSSATREDQLAA